VTVALSAAGLPTDRYCFEGFLPAKRKARKDRLAVLRSETRTIVLYESVHRIRACLADLVDEFVESRNSFLGRELTKMHEQCVQATLGELLRQLDDGAIVAKGEFVIVVTGNDDEPTSSLDIDRLLLELADRLPGKEAAKIAAKVTGTKRNDLYDRILQLKDRK
jgi:16S rRNA (cytidine1402-2'-O)-methyltransferase